MRRHEERKAFLANEQRKAEAKLEKKRLKEEAKLERKRLKAEAKAAGEGAEAGRARGAQTGFCRRGACGNRAVLGGEISCGGGEAIARTPRRRRNARSRKL